ncbi:MAG: ATP-binding cassette domain-containing protein, partial [Candidatus Berkelbacteria bacterium]|nr:ATP-binding cassette domain-containing protein [Candidatus Berkelbacteria bacterium]
EKESYAKQKALETIREVKIEKYAYKNPSRLSGGEQQRVGMARALINNPWIVIADEPTGNLDTANANQIIELLEYLNKEKHRTIIMVTHNLSYLSVANKKIAIIDGEIESEGSDKIKDQIKQELKNI